MSIESAIARFDEQGVLLGSFVNELALQDGHQVSEQHWFLAEAVCFRLYRIYESLIRQSFLYYCVHDRTMNGAPVKSKLVCPDMQTAEQILKSRNKFIEWGKIDETRAAANLIFENGFPIADLVSPIASRLKDLQRFRNFVAHDSDEAADGFKKARQQYIKVGDSAPDTVGKLCLYRKSPLSDISIKIIHRDVQKLSLILKSL